jgi:hypothetical protein
MTLTQPSMSLFAGVLLVIEVVAGFQPTRWLQRLACTIVGLVLVVAPWTYRNYQLLGHFVPVSNTAGISLYVGNNPQATGGYVPVAEPLFEQFDEVGANEEARRLATEWIRQHPAEFAALIPRKQMLFLGDDSVGAFCTLRQGRHESGSVYLPFKAVSNIFWMLLMLLIAQYVFRRRRDPSIRRYEFALLMASLLYFFALHSIFESGSRHHMSSAASLSVLAAAALHGSRERPSAPESP